MSQCIPIIAEVVAITGTQTNHGIADTSAADLDAVIGVAPGSAMLSAIL
jgi:hypothetical protein